MMNWESYSTMCIERGIENPYQCKADFNRAYGIEDKREPITIRPKHVSSINEHCKIVKKLKVRKTKKASADVIKEPREKKPKAIKVPRFPDQPLRRKSDEEIEATKKARLEREYEQRRKKRMERRIAKGLPPVRTDLKGMSEEQRKTHLKALRKGQREREKEKLKIDPEYQMKRKGQLREYHRRYARKNRERVKQWAQQNPEKMKQSQDTWREKNREKLREKAKARRLRKKAEDPNFLIKEREKAKELRDRKKKAVNMPWLAESGCAA